MGDPLPGFYGRVEFLAPWGLALRGTGLLTMPAQSKAQQQAAGAELRRRRAGKKPRRFKGMSLHDLEKLASTPTKGLPKRKKRKK